MPPLFRSDARSFHRKSGGTAAALQNMIAFLFAAVLDCAALDQTPRTLEARACYESLLPTLTDPRTRAAVHERIAWLSTRIGEHEKTLAHFRDALRESREAGDCENEAKMLVWVGFVYQEINDPAAAKTHYQAAFDLARSIGSRSAEALARSHLGWHAWRENDFDQATRQYELTIAIAREIGDVKLEARTLMGLGMSAEALQHYDESLRLHTKALEILRALGDRSSEADALDHSGIALTNLGRAAEAIPLHERSLAIRRETGGFGSELFSLTSLARAQEALGRLHDAAATFNTTIDLIEGVRSKTSARRARATMQAGTRQRYERLLNVLAKLHEQEPNGGHASAALTLSERSRARLTLDAVHEALIRAKSDPSSELLQREDALRDEIDRLGRDLDRFDLDASNAEAERETRERLEARISELHDLDLRIRETWPALAAARSSTPRNASEIQAQLLDGDTMLLEYFLGNDRSFLWTLTRDHLTAHVLPGRAKIESVAVRFHELLAAGDQRKTRHEVERTAERLANLILDGVAFPPNIRRLIIVPDGALHYVPFAALPLANGRALIEDYEIGLAPSASTLLVLRELERAEGSKGIAIVADPVFRNDDPRVHGSTRRAPLDPDLVRAAQQSGIEDLRRLPGTREEARAIARLAKGNASTALDFEADRGAVLDGASRRAVLHIATHALLNAQQPELSGVVLSLVDRNGKPVDGFVRVHDLYRARLTSNLVVLSAAAPRWEKSFAAKGSWVS